MKQLNNLIDLVKGNRLKNGLRAEGCHTTNDFLLKFINDEITYIGVKSQLDIIKAILIASAKDKSTKKDETNEKN